jgi:polyphenol oxidase
MWLFSDNFKVTHGFSDRHGGTSSGPFSSLNLGGTEDSPENIAANRERALEALGIKMDSVCRLKQVHGCDVRAARTGMQEGDALVTNKLNYALAISVADCYPILFHDPVNRVIGAAHAGWRGTLGGIAANTVDAMKELGAKTGDIRVAIGPGISCDKFPVGHDVLAKFHAAGFNDDCFHGNKIDLVKCNTEMLVRSGVSVVNITALNRCTTEKDFFSYRRDNGVTGRMWGIIALQ